MVTATSNGHAVFDPTQFRVRPITKHIVFDRDEVNEGLTRPLEMDVRINRTRGEVDQASTLLRALLEAEKVRAADPDNEALIARENGARLTYFTYMAPWVEDWNLQADRREGDEWVLADVPPPAVAGGAVFELFPVRAQQWIAPAIQNAWLGDDAISKLSRRPDDSASTGASGTPPKKPDGATRSSTSRRNRPKSS